MIGPLAGLEPISLDDLTARAELLTRIDRKYLVTRAIADRLVTELDDRAMVLEIDGAREFGYRSVYFDTPALSSYLGAAQGRRRRFKVRIRTYLDSGDRFVEVKTRGQRGSTVKERVPAWRDDRLDPDDRAYVREALRAGGIEADVRSLAPVLTTEYDRSTLYSPVSGGRTTIDTELHWQLPGGGGFTPRDLAIVETKSTGSASEVDRLLWSMRQRPRSVSKYATGLAVMRPDLPSHRWHPVIRRHFSTLDRTTLTDHAPIQYAPIQQENVS
ncbi:polyphosphate polymerase domain-containing protein [Aeromicrobium stalagmiti]|uniref:polyphosphate polymerase domain-containing protein n=1 Tax=Aeromicrobium stalagmiti TaxID=2738988 RepID=UPI001568CD82|nr:polyphosphate polymerase domain-containing protein [Aeromicrobium stalagmiti]NRQ50435.1 polyphosphate polymerase domain-containing protein [Aeromicrobium stalagmiti]